MQSPSHAKPTVKILCGGVHWCFCVHLLPLQKYLGELKELFVSNIICMIKILKYHLFQNILLSFFNERNSNDKIHFNSHRLNEGIHFIKSEQNEDFYLIVMK